MVCRDARDAVVHFRARSAHSMVWMSNRNDGTGFLRFNNARILEIPSNSQKLDST
jgi:hypothetical protein